MKLINTFLSLVFFGSTAFASEMPNLTDPNPLTEATYTDEQDVATYHWHRVQISTGSLNVAESPPLLEEIIEVSFPAAPEMIEVETAHGVAHHLVATDDEGMSYALVSQEIDSENDIVNNFRIMSEQIAMMSSKQLIYTSFSDNDSFATVAWIDHRLGLLRHMTVFKGEFNFFFLEADVNWDADVETTMEPGTESFDKMIRNLQKARAFTGTFVLRQPME